jgi:hypothetical protein
VVLGESWGVAAVWVMIGGDVCGRQSDKNKIDVRTSALKRGSGTSGKFTFFPNIELLKDERSNKNKKQ